MKSLAALAILISCAFTAEAQTGSVGPNGPNGTQGSNDNGRAYSNGNIPSQYEQNQNRPDSTLSNADTTYRHQQWNDGSASPKNKNKRSSSNNKSVSKTGTASNKQKK